MDAHAIQAQVEALIKSTSNSVVACATSTQQPLVPNHPLAPVLPMSSTGVLPGQTGSAGQPSVASIVAESIASQSLSVAQQQIVGDGTSASTTSNLVSTHDAVVAEASGFRNTFAQYQLPQNHNRGLTGAVRATSAEAVGPQGPSFSPGTDHGDARQTSGEAKSMTEEEEKRVADALIADIDAQDGAGANAAAPKPEPFSGADLAAAAQAIGLEADAELLDGMSEDQRALAAAIKRLGAEHTEAAQKAIQQAAAAAAEAAAARASQELAKTAAQEEGYGASTLAGVQGVADPSTSASASSPASKPGSGPVKRFPCPKCDKAFARAYNLNTHLSTHDPDPNRSKPFACPYPSCKSEGGRSFSRKHDLQRHVASIHENEAEPGIHGDPEEVVGGDTGGLVSLGLGTPGKKFRCENCGRSFVRRDACNRHQCDGKDSLSSRTSMSPSSTPYSSSVSPRSSHSQRLVGGYPIALPPVRPAASGYNLIAAAGSMSRGSSSPTASSSAAKHASGRSSSSLSKEVQAVAKQLQARVEAQSPGPQNSVPSQRNMAPLPGGERRGFPLSAISLYASTGTTGMHSSSSSSSGGSKVQIAK